MIKSFLKSFVQIFLLFIYSINCIIAQKYIVSLSGANASPPNASAGTGSATITVSGNTMRVQCAFSGLTGNTTASHIHAATAMALTGTAGVATTTPSFTGFPLGVTSGSYDNTLDMTQASSFNAAYITAHGGTVSQAWADLKVSMQEGKSYFDIHSNAFPGGEIRGFLPQACISKKTGNWNDSSVWSCSQVPTNSSYVVIAPTHIVTIPDNIVANAKSVEINGELKKGTNASLVLFQ